MTLSHAFKVHKRALLSSLETGMTILRTEIAAMWAERGGKTEFVEELILACIMNHYDSHGSGSPCATAQRNAVTLKCSMFQINK
jgi:hypothetical protein